MPEVLVVGGGPTGLALANALGVHGVETLLVEQEPGVAELPRAVSVDDEAMRFMQSIGLRSEARRVTLPGTGTRYYGARGQLLAYARGPAQQRYGHPVKNPIDHSEFQQMLLDGLDRFAHVDAQHDTRLVSFEQDAESVTATVQGPASVRQVNARFLVGADGGRSVVRTAIGEEPMVGSAFAQRWLVIDTVNDAHDQRYAMHYGDPSRPHVIVVGREGRCRYEFLLHDGEPQDGPELLALAQRLVMPFRVLDAEDVVRCSAYSFYALVARRFSRERAFLAGDAAHMMPPFAGQGANSGLRDADNLSWKLAAVLRGQAEPSLLDTYTAERRPHVQAMVNLSVRMGGLMMTRNRVRAASRDLIFVGGQRIPTFRRFFREMRFKPPASYGQGFVVGQTEDSPIGSMLVQPAVLDIRGMRVALDDLLGRNFALLGIAVAPSELTGLSAEVWRRLGAVRVHVTLDDRLPARDTPALAVADADGLLAAQLDQLRGSVVLVRPDRYIAGAFAPADEDVFGAGVERLLGTRARLEVA